MIIVDFHEYGPVAPRTIDPHELREIYRGCRAMMAEFEPDHIQELLEDWEIALAWSSTDGAPVAADWYTRALVVMCLRGLRGERAPVWRTRG